MEENEILEIQPVETNSITPTTQDTNEVLKVESKDIMNKIVSERDPAKAKELTAMFNFNQNKKTMARTETLNDVMDIMAGQLLNRMRDKPDEISNQELLQGMKVVQDIMDKNQTQIKSAEEKPLIQVNEQYNNVNLNPAETLSKESRDNIKNAVLGIISKLNSTAETKEPIDVTQSEEQTDGR